MSSAAAQTANPSSWQYEFTPYLWAASLDGNTRIKPPSDGSAAGFSDIFSHLDLGLLGTFEARKGRWGILADGIYIKLSTSDTFAGGRINADITPQQYLLAGTYRVAPGPVAVDLLGGARYIDVDVNLATALGTRSASASMWNPVVGVRALVPISERWTLLGYGDIGTLSGNSAWQLIGGVNYKFNDTFSGKFGYRHLHINLGSNDLDFNMAVSGFYVGVGIRF
jgi:opacity protein-like surface antigen